MRILLASSISPDAVTALEANHDLVNAIDGTGDMTSLLRDCEVIIFRSGVLFSAETLSAAPDLRLVIRAGSGFDNIDLDYVRAHGIRVVRIPAPSAQAVAEMTLGLLLAVSRNIVKADALIRKGHWPKRELGGPLLKGKTLGVVGAGNIGARVGELGFALGMRVLGCIKHDMAGKTAGLSVRGIELCDFDTVISESDFVSLHTPLDETTRGMINASVIGKMKPGVVLVNMSRGGVLDEGALYQALESGHIAGAALDVHEREGEGVVSTLAGLPNVVLTPHIGGMALESQRFIGERLLELLDAFIDGTFDDTVTAEEVIV
jgi:D-3-phosphoglycerate dehydrogenase / 2-oxoglutarate reductase